MIQSEILHCIKFGAATFAIGLVCSVLMVGGYDCFTFIMVAMAGQARLD